MRRLNGPFLLKFLAAFLVIGVGVHFLHGYQVQYQAGTFLELAQEAEAAADSDKAMIFYEHYLGIHPQDASARALYALALNRNARTTADRARVILEMGDVLTQDPAQVQVRYRLIQNLIANGRIGDALPHVPQLLPQWPDAAEVHHIHGWVLDALKDYSGAARAFAKAVQENPARINSYALWAEVLLRQPGRDEDPEKQARLVMDGMVQANPKNFLAYLTRADFLRKRSPEQAKKDLDQALVLAPEEPDALLAMSAWHLAKGDANEARRLVEQGCQLHPRDVPLHRALAYLELGEGRRPQAIRLLRAMQAELPPLNDLAVVLVDLLLDQGERLEAEARLTDLVASGLESPQADYLQGRLAIQKRKWADAEKALAHLAEHHPTWPRLPLLRGRLEEARGNLGGAAKYYTEAIRLGEMDLGAVRTVAAELAARKQFLEADRVLLQWEARAPLPPELTRLGTEIALALSNLEKARARALQPFLINSADTRTQTWLVRVYQALGEMDKAETLARRAAANQPQSPEAWITLVRFLAGQGKRAEALEAAQLASDSVPTPIATATLALCQEALGDLTEAERLFLKALKEQPNDFVLAMQAVDFFIRADRPARAAAILPALLRPETSVPRDYLPRLRLQLAIALAEDPARRGVAMKLLEGKGSAGPGQQRARAFVMGMDAKHHAEAVALFEASQKQGPASDEEMYLLARIHEAGKRFFDAEGLLKQMVLLQPENPRWLAGLVRSLQAQGRTEEAGTYLRRLERVEPTSARTEHLRKSLTPL